MSATFELAEAPSRPQPEGRAQPGLDGVEDSSILLMGWPRFHRDHSADVELIFRRSAETSGRTTCEMSVAITFTLAGSGAFETKGPDDTHVHRGTACQYGRGFRHRGLSDHIRAAGLAGRPVIWSWLMPTDGCSRPLRHRATVGRQVRRPVDADRNLREARHSLRGSAASNSYAVSGTSLITELSRNTSREVVFPILSPQVLLG